MDKEALLAAINDLMSENNNEELDRKRKKYAPPEEVKPAHGVHITIVTGHKEPVDEMGKDEPKDPLEDPEELAKLLADEPEPEEKPKSRRKK